MRNVLISDILRRLTETISPIKDKNLKKDKRKPPEIILFSISRRSSVCSIFKFLLVFNVYLKSQEFTNIRSISCLSMYPQAFSPVRTTLLKLYFDNFWTVLSSSSMVHTLSSLQSGFLTILYIFLLLIAPISSKRFTIRYTVADPMPGSRRDAL